MREQALLRTPDQGIVMLQNIVKNFFITSAIALSLGVAVAQDAQISGLITDPSHAVIPGATAVVTNQETGIERTVQTNESGFFVLPGVQPGVYQIRITAQGFRAASRIDIKLDVEKVARIDFQLELGAITEVIEVMQTAPLLEISRATMGTVIENKTITDLPLDGRNPFSLVALVPGVITSGGGSTPFMGGGRNAANEVSIDGASNVAPENNSGVNRLVYTPQVDAVEEFKVELNSLAAEYGRFAGGVINVVTKSGTNDIHGSGFWFARRKALDANNFFANKFGAETSGYRRDQYGATVGGPLVRNRTFFFGGYQANRQRDQQQATLTVPSESWRAGDFSDIGTLGFPIFDPFSNDPNCGSLAACNRTPFANNIIPQARIAETADKAQGYLPAPNAAPQSPFNTNNYFKSGTDSDEGYRVDVRIDDNPTDSWRVFGRWSLQSSERASFLPWDNAAAPVTGPLDNFNQSVSLDNTFTLSPTLIASVRYGFGRANDYRRNYSDGFDVRTLGFPENFYEQTAVNGLAFPRFTMGGGTTNFGAENWTQLSHVSMSHSLSGSITKVMNRHTLKAGAEARKMFVNFEQFGRPAGEFSFNQRWTRENFFVTNSRQGFPYASFLLGAMDTARIHHEPAAASASLYQAFYLQDDWRVSNRLTLNLGLRYDVDLPRTERFNRLSYFDAAAASPLAGLVNSSTCLECDDLQGAIRFADADNRQQTSADRNNWGPRFGLAYQLNAKTVLRTGFGISYLPSPMQAAGTSGTAGMQGFRSDTSSLVTIDGRAIRSTLGNPFPDGFNLPKGTTAGAGTDLGFAIDDSFINNYESGMAQQWNFNIQRLLPGNMAIEVGYLGNRGVWLPDGDGNRSFNQLPKEFLSLGSTLGKAVANPFYGVISDPTSPLAQPSVTLNQLLRAYPQYTAVEAVKKSNGNSEYHAFTVRLDKRFSNGLSFLVSFTGGKLMDDASSTVNFLGPTVGSKLDHNDLSNEWSVSSFDISRRFVASWTYELPFGRNNAIGGSATGVLNHLISGWQTNGILLLSGGTPLWINGTMDASGLFSGQRAVNNGQSAAITGGTTDERLNQWFDTSVFTRPQAYTLGNVSRTLPDVRAPGRQSVDLSFFKNNYFGDRYNLQLRVEMFNALNTPQWAFPNISISSSTFGQITNADSARQIQLATKFLF